MNSKRLFGGTRLGDIANSVREKGESSTPERSATQAVLPTAELALQGRTSPGLTRETVLSVDPRRCRGWKYHNRTDAWYTRERCEDLIRSIPKDGQQEPALARRIVGDAGFDYELIYGMRRRFACEVTSSKLKVRVVDISDAQAAVLMHLENADRQDITPMERALSFQAQIEAKLFATQEALAAALNVSKGQVTKMLKAAQLLGYAPIANLMADKSAVPVEQAYKLGTLMERPGAKDVVLQAAKNLARRDEDTVRDPRMVLKALLASLDQSRKLEPIRREYNVGKAGRAILVRNARGKVTVAFPKGLGSADRDAVIQAMDQILKDLS
ncbi:MAG: ParB/RepB/Spo0J family partition protein [Pseudomonadota bacterium]|nr:ParB/RepB/Spo0J family partition protein [Pseudomonadota bacterium]